MRLQQTSDSPVCGDQAEKLRQLRRSAISPKLSLDQHLRLVLISELPNSDCGARFAFHLASALDQLDPATGDQANLLLDLAPAASRLPKNLSDQVPEHSYAQLWHELVAGNEFMPCRLRSTHSLAIAAAPQSHALDCEQQARVYEDLLRQLRQQASYWKWLVIIAVDHVLPIDRAYWLAADDLVLISNCGPTAQQHAAALRSRQLDQQSSVRLWTLAKQTTAWWRPRRVPSIFEFRPDGIGFSQELPSTRWTDGQYCPALRTGSRLDKRLARRAAQIAQTLCQFGNCQTAPVGNDCAATTKKIQLPSVSRSIEREPGIVRA